MRSREDICRDASTMLASAPTFAALVGFDGFVDSICDAVSTRSSMEPEAYDRIDTMGAFADRVARAAGRSTNIEVFVREDRFGGNGPLMASALAGAGADVTYIGAIGTPEDRRMIDPRFEAFADRCVRAESVGVPGHTTALEFVDGKLMLNTTVSVQDVTWARLIEDIGLDDLRSVVASSRLLGIVNWSLMGGVEGIWEGLRTEVFEGLDREDRRVFVDLSDPAKRTDESIALALGHLRALNEVVPVTLGLNLAESERIASVMGLEARDTSNDDEIRVLASSIRVASGLDTVVVHPRHGAAGATASDEAWFDGPLTGTPLLSTGAGDHFNAGFATAQVSGLPLDACLATGCAVSGSYVREGRAPTRASLCAFLESMPLPETD